MALHRDFRDSAETAFAWGSLMQQNFRVRVGRWQTWTIPRRMVPEFKYPRTPDWLGQYGPHYSFRYSLRSESRSAETGRVWHFRKQGQIAGVT